MVLSEVAVLRSYLWCVSWPIDKSPDYVIPVTQRGNPSVEVLVVVTWMLLLLAQERPVQVILKPCTEKIA